MQPLWRAPGWEIICHITIRDINEPGDKLEEHYHFGLSLSSIFLWIKEHIIFCSCCKLLFNNHDLCRLIISWMFLFLAPAPALPRWVINLNDPTLCSFKDAPRMQRRQIEVNICSPALRLPSAHLDYGPTLQRCANIINPFSCGNGTFIWDQREALSPPRGKCHISIFQGSQTRKNWQTGTSTAALSLVMKRNARSTWIAQKSIPAHGYPDRFLKTYRLK